MNQYSNFQIPLKSYLSEYKQCKTLQRNEFFEVNYVRNITTRLKHIAIRKSNCPESELLSIISELHLLTHASACLFINRFKGYAIEPISHHRHSKTFNVNFLFQFGEISLDTFVQTPSERSRKDSIGLLNKLHQQLLETSVYLLENGLDLIWLTLDLKFITMEIRGEAIANIKFSYFPFKFLHSSHQSKDFATRIYSLKELKNLDEHSKNEQIESLFEKGVHSSRRDDIIETTEADMVQKIGLLFVKLVLLCCQEMHTRQNEVILYALNKDFQIDYNWELINPLLIQCFKQKDYIAFAKTIQYMLLGSDRKLKQCIQMAIEMSQQRHSARKKDKDSNHKQSARKERSSLASIGTLPILKDSHQALNKEDILQRKHELQQQIKKIPNTIVVNHQNGRYVGQIVNKKREGFGIFYFQEGQIYGGQWKDDEMIGTGVYLFLGQDEYYEGLVQYGTRSGQGRYCYKNGNIYNGNWLKDYKEGYGQLYSADENQIYKGSFKDNMQHGLGTIEYANGSKFQGSFELGLKEGTGRIFDSKNNLTFKGTWKKNQLQGRGAIYFQNGDYYEGEMRRGMMHGEGLYKYKCGTVYLGGFIENQMSGKCTISYANGDKFQGYMLNGRFTSEGTYHWSQDNVTAISQWSDGVQYGETQLIHDGNSINTHIRQGNAESFAVYGQN